METRRAEFDDCKDLADLIARTGGVAIYKATFGTYNLSNLIENSYLSLLTECPAANEQKDTVCFMSVNDGMSLFSSEPDAYTKILSGLSQYIPATTINTMFVNFWILDESSKFYEEACIDIIKRAFAGASNTDFLIWVVPKNLFPSDFILNTFSLLTFDTTEDRAKETIRILDGYKVLFLHRSKFLPRLQVREARIEDNDDLIPILQNTNPDILVGQESYFLADLIQRQDDVNRFYVGLRQKAAVAGMLATSRDVNVPLIQKVFDISPFPDLMIKKEERPLPPPLLVAVVGDLRLVNTAALQESLTALNCIFVNAETMKLPLPGGPTIAGSVAEAKGGAADSKQASSAPAGGGGAGAGTKAEDKGRAPSAADAKAPAKDTPTSVSDADAKCTPEVADSKDGAGDAVEPGPPALSPLEAYLKGVLDAHNSSPGAVPPPAIVLFGYPRNEQEAVDRLEEVVGSFDYLVEAHNVAEDAEEDEEDEYLQQHLDAVEVLKEHYFAAAEGKSGMGEGRPSHYPQHSHSETPYGAAGHKAMWRKVAVTGSVGQTAAASASETEAASQEYAQLDAANSVAGDIGRIVDHRHARIEAQKAKDREEPPKANAFALTVFCMEPDFVSRGSDLIKIAFEDNPHHDYCLFMFDSEKPPPMDQLRCMTYVSLLPGVSFDQSLYLMHRSAFLSDYLRVVRIDRSMLGALDEFAASMPDAERDALVDAAGAALVSCDVDLRDNPAETCFAVTIGRTIVGVIALSRRLNSPEDATWFRANYHIDDLINFERHRVRNQAIVTQWQLDPVYSPFTRRILQDIMRQTGKTLLYYQSPRDRCPPKNVLEEFVALKPRRRMQPGGALKCEFTARPAAAIGGLGSDCPLFCITKHFLSRPKDIVAKRVVVVGGSPHAYALLDTLCSVPHLTFPNIYLVGERPPAALTFAPDPDGHEDYSGILTVHNEQYPTEQELYATGMGHKVQVLRGRLSDIDRENKAIVISDETVLQYDVLVLSTCTQDSSTMAIPSLARTHPARCADIGVFSLGNPQVDAKALRYIQHRYPGRNDDVVVSGSGLAVFAAVARLLKFGVAPMRITVVVKDDEGTIQGLAEKNIVDPLVRGILSAGIKMCWGFVVADAHLSHTGFLSSLELKRTVELPVPVVTTNSRNQPQVESKAPEPVMIACMALLLCNNAVCDRDMFSAIVDSGLVFDGGLVVDANFRTVDRSIYAMSDYTRFSRIYKDALPHNTFNAKEVGAYVALRVLEHHLDPTASRPHDYAVPSAQNSALARPYVPPPRNARPPLPIFLLPRAVSCDLPGGLNFFSSRLPIQPEESVSYLTNSAMAEAAGDVRGAKRNRNFVLKTDLLGNVVEVSYVGEDYVENRSFALLPGFHEAFLNSAAHTHGKGWVTDWVEFLRQDWAAPIYQDRFPVLVHALRRSLATDKGMMVMLSRVFERAENCSDPMEIADQRRDLMGAHGELAPDTTLRTIETEAFEFLKENRALLPRFHMPNK